MKTASILLAVFAVLGFVSEAGATTVIPEPPLHDFTVEVGKWTFGVREVRLELGKGEYFDLSFIYLGPFGSHESPFTATQGLIGFCFILSLLILVPVVLTFRWKKKRVAP